MSKLPTIIQTYPDSWHGEGGYAIHMPTPLNYLDKLPPGTWEAITYGEDGYLYAHEKLFEHRGRMALVGERPRWGFEGTVRTKLRWYALINDPVHHSKHLRLKYPNLLDIKRIERVLWALKERTQQAWKATMDILDGLPEGTYYGYHPTYKRIEKLEYEPSLKSFTSSSVGRDEAVSTDPVADAYFKKCAYAYTAQAKVQRTTKLLEVAFTRLTAPYRRDPATPLTITFVVNGRRYKYRSEYSQNRYYKPVEWPEPDELTIEV